MDRNDSQKIRSQSRSHWANCIKDEFQTINNLISRKLYHVENIQVQTLLCGPEIVLHVSKDEVIIG
jgi:hypothetical protein